LKDRVASAGFTIDHCEDDRDIWAFVATSKSGRNFTARLEGWSEAASRQRPVAHSSRSGGL
jgi:hypothetical protein